MNFYYTNTVAYPGRYLHGHRDLHHQPAMNKTFASSMTGCFPVLALVAALGCNTAWARVRLDDSASPRALVQSPNMVSEYGYPVNQYVPGALVAQRGIVDFGRIEYRLATAPYVGRHARIYFVIPPVVSGLRSPQGLLVSWRSEWQLLPPAAADPVTRCRCGAVWCVRPT